MSQATITIEDIIKKTSDLPTIPAAAIRVMQAAESSNSTAASVAQILSADQSLSARVLRLANSAFYGLSRKVSDLQEAVVILGMRNIKNLALVAGTYPWMSRPLPGYSLGPRAMWTHAFGTAVGAQQIAKVSGKVKDDVAFTAGLLHDIGKVAVSIWLENKIVAILNYANREGMSFDEAERKILGYDHTQVGEHLATTWNLPDDLVAAVRWHHMPDDAPGNPPLVDCVHLGNYLTMTMGFGLGGDGLLYRFSESSLTRLGLQAIDLDQVTDTFVESYEEYEKLFEDLVAA